MSKELEQVLNYHELSKHAFHAFAPGPGRLDWSNQPNPFRQYSGAPRLTLERDAVAAGDPSSTGDPLAEPHYETALLTTSLPSEPMTARTVSRLFFDSLAISAWKAIQGSKWALRVNPSSGNLHPTEGYWISGPVVGLCNTPIVAHYSPLEHELEVRARFSEKSWEELSKGFPKGTAFVGITSIHWREAWKYGERGFRYCQHDVGHAIASVSISAAGLGWTARLVDHWSQEDLRILLGLPTQIISEDETEVEQPDCLLAIIPMQVPMVPESEWIPGSNWTPEFQGLSWYGKPNRLSPEHIEWMAINEVTLATEKPKTSPHLYTHSDQNLSKTDRPITRNSPPISLRTLIHQRRSAVDFDERCGITRNAFYELLEKTLPAKGRRPFNTLPWAPLVHLGLFVHRVQDVDPGLYILVRNPSHQKELQSLMNPDFTWKKPKGCPPNLDLYQLAIGDARLLAKKVSCGQDIAGDSAFSLGMISQFDLALKEYGPWFYPRLFWECGMVGQTLYLEAEAMGIRGTGIGCFFDNPIHESFGLKGQSYQSLYHFTIGSPIEDTRLTTLPAYPTK